MIFWLESVYMSYLLVYVVRPSNANGENDDIFGVLVFYFYPFMLIGYFLKWCIEKFIEAICEGIFGRNGRARGH